MCYLHFVARLNYASQRATPAYRERLCGALAKAAAFVEFKFSKICQSIKHNGALNQIETLTIKIRKAERAPRVVRSIKTIFIARIDFYCLSLIYECISHCSETDTDTGTEL